MNKFIVFIFFLYCIHYVTAQSYADYNIRGDQALKNNDFSGALTWYGEGLQECDQYSIKRLTDLWKDQEKMRRSMNLVTMKRCYDCLILIAESKDQEAMLLLSDYYKLGIGVNEDPTLAEYWLSEYAVSIGINPYESPVDTLYIADSTLFIPPVKQERKFRFFAAYTFSPTMPVGITIGGFGKFGFYASYKTSVNSTAYDLKCTNTRVPEIDDSNRYEETPVYLFDDERWHSQMITGGILFPLKKQKLFVSLGGGYGFRDYYRHLRSENIVVNNQYTDQAWCYNTEASYKCLVLEVGGMYKYKKLIITGGVNSTAFEDLDGYIGIGLAF